MTTLAPELDRAQLVADNLDLLHIVAIGLIQRGLAVDEDELTQDGYDGLRRAARRYDPDRSVQFRTYARARIAGAMLDGVRGRDHVSRLGRRQAASLDRARYRYAAREHHFPTPAELAGETGCTTAQVAEIQRRDHQSALVSLEAEINGSHGEDYEPRTVADFLPDPDRDTQREALERIDRDRLPALLMRLPERERFVISLSFYEDMTLTAIGEVLGVTESRVSQIRTQALKRLRAMVERGQA